MRAGDPGVLGFVFLCKHFSIFITQNRKAESVRLSVSPLNVTSQGINVLAHNRHHPHTHTHTHTRVLMIARGIIDTRCDEPNQTKPSNHHFFFCLIFRFVVPKRKMFFYFFL